MPFTRVDIALSQGLLELPDGCGVLNAPGDVDLGLDIRATQSYYPDYARLISREIETSPTPEGSYPACLVQCHRARLVSFDFLRQAVENTAVNGVIAINGAKTDGIEAIAKQIRNRFEGVEVFSKAHGKLVWFPRPANLPDMSDWTAKPFQIAGGWHSYPGIFSSDAVDKGSVFLAENLPKLYGKVADLGAGWGYLSRHILTNEKVDTLDLIETDHHGLEAAKANVTDPRASFHWADALGFQGKGYDTVVMNPPFHITRKPDPALGQSFIRKAAQILGPKGSLWMVANRNLPYEAALEDCFQMVKPIAQNGGFKVIHAAKPRTSKPKSSRSPR
jgi:16S rRNA (guanine1207-N2)-methyltransferase